MPPFFFGGHFPSLGCCGNPRCRCRQKADPGHGPFYRLTRKVDGKAVAKLGCLFTQTAWGEDGFPIRDPDSTTCTGASETAEEFGKRLYLEAWNRGWTRAQQKVVMGDGAVWIWNLSDQHFPGAVQIVDLYHARQHLWEPARRLYPNDPVGQQAWMKVDHRGLLDKDKIVKLVLRTIESTAEVLEKIRTETDYFEHNAERMPYPKFRRQHLFVGSDVVKPNVRLSSLPASNNRARSRPSVAPMRSSPYNAVTLIACSSGPLLRARVG